MANQKHLDILKQGVEAWNQWRKEHPVIQPDLSNADLRSVDLRGINLSGVVLSRAKLTRAVLGATVKELNFVSPPYIFSKISNESILTHADLSEADLCFADLQYADLSSADLTKAVLQRTNLKYAKLSGSNLNNSFLTESDLSGARLDYADLRKAVLHSTNLSHTFLSYADLGGAYMYLTNLGSTDLRLVKGLDTVKHFGPSSIGIDTIYYSQGQIPKSFLHEAGVPNSFLEVMAAITNCPIEYYTVFISYSSKDQDFAERLYADLQSNGVRCWFAPEHMKTGDEFRQRIDESIRVYDKLLLVLSEHSVESTWVKKEVETAFEKEQQQNWLMLFPIRLDDTVKRTTRAWAADIRRLRHIADFTDWKIHDEYQKSFNRLLRDLKASS
jgi:uncharacterized protein YjbI with pentapeptide repeats